MSAFQAVAKVAARMGQQFGTPVCLRTYTDSFDAATQTNTRTPTDRVLKGLIERPFISQGAMIGSDQGALTGALRVTIFTSGLSDPPFTRNPMPDDRLLLGFTNAGTDAAPIVSGGTSYVVKEMEPQYAGDTVVSYALTVVQA